VRKTQHQNPEFGHTQDEFFKCLQKSTLPFKEQGEVWCETSKTIKFCVKLSFILSFIFLSASATATYILTARICRTAIVTLKPCALNPEFQHFILRFVKNFLTLWIPLKEGIGGWKEAQRQGEDRVTYFTDNSAMQKIWKFLMCWEGPRWWPRASPHSGNTLI